MLDLHEVIEKVVPHDRMVGKDRRHLHFGGILSRSSPCTLLKAPMRFMRSQPKAEGLTIAHLGEEVIKVGRIIPVAHPSEGRFHLSLIEFRSSRVDRSPPRLESPGAPALAGKSNGVTRLLQQLRVGCEFGGQGAVDVACFFQAPDRLSGQDGAARRPAGRGVAKGTGEANALTGDTIEGGRFDLRFTVGPGVGIGLIV